MGASGMVSSDTGEEGMEIIDMKRSCWLNKQKRSKVTQERIRRPAFARGKAAAHRRRANAATNLLSSGL
jgi:hypothetical protein